MSEVDRSRECLTAPAQSAPGDFLIACDGSDCHACSSCVRHCPAQAIRVEDGHPQIIESRCVKCGACVVECGNGGYAVRDDLGAVRALLASGRRVVVVLASEYLAALHPMTASEVEFALETAGFSSIETTVLGEELIAVAWELACTQSQSPLPQLRSTCPVVVSWVELYHPQLSGALVTIIPPYIAQARLIKATALQDVAVVYVSPCWARKDEIFDPQLAGAVDVAIGFDELRSLLAEQPSRHGTAAPGPSATRRPQAAKELSLTDGFPRRFLTERDLTSQDLVAARGLAEIDRLLSAIESGEIAPRVVDLLNCEGCADGPAVNPALSVFAKRNVIAAETARQPRPSVDSSQLLDALPTIDTRRFFSPRPVPDRVSSIEEAATVPAEGVFDRHVGTPNCDAGEDDTTDALTSLGNRRVLDERLEAETARAKRHGLKLAFVVIGMDGFSQVNDRCGHPAGDRLLIQVGHTLVATLRSTDVVVRYGGDEFAVILPETNKTEAWAVAERIRAALARLWLLASDGTRISVSGSIGVAGYGPAADSASALVAAAGAALRRAKESGRSRVELAPG
ncbi:MAG: diguanylate cyclase [Coriobacteriia bacterium]